MRSGSPKIEMKFFESSLAPASVGEDVDPLPEVFEELPPKIKLKTIIVTMAMPTMEPQPIDDSEAIFAPQ